MYSRIRKQDRQAFVKVYDTYVTDIYRFIYFKVSDEEEARDITSRTFLKTWDYLQSNQVTDRSTLKSLLYRVARNLVIDHYREKGRRDKAEVRGEENIPEVADSRQDIARKAEVESDMELVRKKMQGLKAEYREVVIMRYINEMSVQEIASILGKSPGNVRVMVYRALNTLRDMLNE